jgi:dTDP-4-amino-4,6-dideoxygalactose transaminase
MKGPDKPIYVTQPSLPPLEEFIPYLEEIWDNKWLTNNGPFHRQLEKTLCDHLGVEHIALCANGTIALMIALRALELDGEVITTPFSFVATSHALDWNKLAPVFVDIEPTWLNLDPARIEAAITPRTAAILPVHCYGNPCDVDAIEGIAERHGLRVIYDAAHAFGVRRRGESLLRRGDLAVLSFHATKVFNTFEGGAIVCPDAETKQNIDYLKNFGFAGETSVVMPGINGKMSEVNAAFGLLQLRYVDAAIARRRVIDQCYRDELASVQGVRCLPIPSDTASNFSYFPVLIGPGYRESRDQLYTRLTERGVYARRYFFPLISDFPMYRDLPSARPENLPVAHDAASKVLCLPIHPDMDDSEVATVVGIIEESL